MQTLLSLWPYAAITLLGALTGRGLAYLQISKAFLKWFYFGGGIFAYFFTLTMGAMFLEIYAYVFIPLGIISLIFFFILTLRRTVIEYAKTH